jgi:hypothetical protein
VVAVSLHRGWLNIQGKKLAIERRIEPDGSGHSITSESPKGSFLSWKMIVNREGELPNRCVVLIASIRSTLWVRSIVYTCGNTEKSFQIEIEPESNPQAEPERPR